MLETAEGQRGLFPTGSGRLLSMFMGPSGEAFRREVFVAAHLFRFFREYSSALKVFSIFGIVLLTPCVCFFAKSSSPKPESFPLHITAGVCLGNACWAEEASGAVEQNEQYVSSGA